MNDMVKKQDLIKISKNEWEIPASYREDMNVPVRIFVNEKLLEQIFKDKSLEQAVNAATLPGLIDHVYVMPDMHQGYGFPIGGVAASKFEGGVISPGGIGYDINCGVRMLTSRIMYEEAAEFLEELLLVLDQKCPSGVGVGGSIRLSNNDLLDVCRNGSHWTLKNGYANGMDIRRTEGNGRLEGADPRELSDKAIKRGLKQLGTLGAGNHFIEIELVEKVFDEEAAHAMGLVEGCLTLQIHCGSRGLGHQVCTDYVREFQSAVRKYNIKLPDRELVCAPLESEEGQRYYRAMQAAANYAFANRQVLSSHARKAFELVLAGRVIDFDLDLVYDVAHNIGKTEMHKDKGEMVTVCVHRKGATRAFPPGHAELPLEYREIGQPVLVPGSMGTSSWVLAGNPGSMELSLGSCCHGAGRQMSRGQAKKAIRGDKLLQQLNKAGILVKAGSLPGLAEEAPQVYKDVDQVIQTVNDVGIARKVARLIPLGVIKG